MPKLAIVLWYMEDQNEPSKPNRELIELPDDPVKRDAFLIAEYFAGYGEEDPGEVTVTETNGYGDLQVSSGGVHMFVTYAELPPTPVW